MGGARDGQGELQIRDLAVSCHSLLNCIFTATATLKKLVHSSLPPPPSPTLSCHLPSIHCSSVDAKALDFLAFLHTSVFRSSLRVGTYPSTHLLCYVLEALALSWILHLLYFKQSCLKSSVSGNRHCNPLRLITPTPNQPIRPQTLCLTL